VFEEVRRSAFAGEQLAGLDVDETGEYVDEVEPARDEEAARGSGRRGRGRRRSRRGERTQ
jgi:hypothetical protein